jgi:UTP--glucose-1-phosphate uridylyltransferase
MSKIKKAVIPAAGLGTRVLPATKAMPKEMIPIVDKPAIQYIVEEAVKSGITDILIIISRGKSIIEDHFDRMPELERRLESSGKHEFLKDVIDISKLANISFVRQQEQLGLGHAVLQAKNFVGNEPFAVLYGDDVIIGEDPCIGQLCRAYEEYGKGTVCIKEVSKEDIKKYSSLKVESLRDNLYSITDMIEKPQTEAEVYSYFSILGRCVLTPEIFDVLENIPFGAGNELQLTDAMRILARRDGFVGVDFTGKRYDMGNKLGILKATVEVALNREDIRDDFIKYLSSLDLDSLKSTL